MSWQPIHPKHAIERTRIVVQFADKLPQRTLEKLGEVFEAKREGWGFGPRIEVQAHTLVVNPDTPAQQIVTKQTRGWQYLRQTSSGVATEAVVLDPDGLVYENVEYASWKNFWARASEMLVPIVDLISDVADFSAFSLEYFDRFNFEGDITSAVPSGLISAPLLATLSEDAQSGLELWHVHLGWYETHAGVRVLVNQNIDANDVELPDTGKTRTVGIYTKLERRERTNIVDAARISADIEIMHSMSKRVFSLAVTPEAQDRIGLNGNQHD